MAKSALSVLLRHFDYNSAIIDTVRSQVDHALFDSLINGLSGQHNGIAFSCNHGGVNGSLRLRLSY